MSAQARNTIVIIGAGFGGIYTYQRLKARIDPATTRVVIVNKTNHFLFTPLLHEVATGGLAVPNATQAVREIIDPAYASFLQGEVTGIDTHARTVQVGETQLRYDHLVIATGATTNFMGVAGAAEHTLTLKDFGDAIKLRRRIITQFENAQARVQPQVGELDFVVVGGGPTGVEVVTEMADLFAYTFRYYYGRTTLRREHVSLTLVHADERLVKQFHPTISHRALDTIRHAGIQVMLNARVQRVGARGVILADGSEVRAQTVIWAAGVKPVIPPVSPNLPMHTCGRIAVDQYLRVQGLGNVWALGDVAAVPDGKEGVAPMHAQAAVQQAKIVARNIVAALANDRPLRAYRYRSKGDLMSLGRYHAAGDIAGIRFFGPFAWWLWRTVYLFNFASWAKRIRIAVDWTVNLFYPRDITVSH